MRLLLIKKTYNLFNRLIGIICIILTLSNLSSAKVSAASFSFTSENITLKKNCPENLNVYIDGEGQSTNAADVKILYNPSEIKLIDSNINTQEFDIENGDAFTNLYGVNNNVTSGYIEFAGDSSGGVFSAKRTFAILKLKSLGSTTNTTLSFDFTSVGDTLDSNIASANTFNDILTSVKNVNVTFSDDFCDLEDKTPPNIFLISPNNTQTGISANANVIIQLTDDLSGVDLDTLLLYLNNIAFSLNHPAITITGTPKNYTLSIDLEKAGIVSGSILNISIFVQDLSGNANDETFSLLIIAGSIIQLPTISFPIIKWEDLGDLGIISLITSFLALLFALLSGLNLGGLLANLLALFVGRRRRSWGVVTDVDTGKPLPLATCRLFASGSIELIANTVSGLDGTYGFALQSGGDYRLEVSKGFYKPFIRDIYIPLDTSGFVFDINLAKIDSEYISTISFGERLGLYSRSIFTILRNVFFVIGSLFSILAVYISPNAFNIVVLILYVIALFLWVYSVLYNRRRLSTVVDAESGEPIPYAVIKLYDLLMKKNIDTIVAGPDGTFDFFGEPGEYGLLALSKKYVFPSKRYSRSDLVVDVYSSLLKVNLKKGRNRITVYMDRNDKFDELSTDNKSVRLSNPFS
jgi:hypothetical protein